MKTKKIIDTSLGVPSGLIEMFECTGCGSLFRAKAIDINAECLVCGMPPDDTTTLSKVKAICNDCIVCHWGCSAVDLAENILDEINVTKP